LIHERKLVLFTFLQSQVSGREEDSISSQAWTGRRFYPFSKRFLLTLHLLLSAFMKSSDFGVIAEFWGLFLGSFFSASVVICFVSLVHVSFGVAQAQSVSMAMLLIPLITLTNPLSPKWVPQEFLTVQYLTPSSTPYPTIEMSWTMFRSPVVS
jgi:hypothetical protein